MTEEINDYFTRGLVIPAFQAEVNILIWQYVADESAFLKTLAEHYQKQYVFIQRAAQTNFVLSLGKLFDHPRSKFPTRCILSFLNLLLADDLKPVVIIETTSTKRLLRQQNCPPELIEAVEANNSSEFPKLFANYYLKNYRNNGITEEISKMKMMRDKAEAHNEAIDDLFLDFATTTKLLEFALDIISVFGMAYHSTGWRIDDHSMLKTNAERNASFIRLSINDLKKKADLFPH